MEWRKLDVDGVEGLLGRGVYYGAGRSEAAQCGGDDVVVIGAGNSAGQAVLNLANAGARVRCSCAASGLGRTMSAYLVTRIEAHPLIDVRLGTQAEGLREDGGRLTGVTVADSSGATEESPARALFICTGGAPRNLAGAQSGPGAWIAPDILTRPRPAREGQPSRGLAVSATRSRSRRACRACSPAGDVRRARRSGWRPRSARARWSVALAHRRSRRWPSGRAVR